MIDVATIQPRGAMTAAIGHPTLRRLRVRIGNFWLGDLPPGDWRVLSTDESHFVLEAGKTD